MTATRFGTPAAHDCAALSTAVLLSLAWYAPRLGFYSDDWAFIGRYVTAADQTVGGFYQASHSAQHAMRPVQLWLCAALYRLFGMEPLGYHLFNALLLVLNPILVYGIARELRVPRPIRLTIALLYALLPSYSTDRVWYVAFAITLSMTACLVSIHADLKAAVAPVRAGVGWKALGAAALLVSGLSYEVALPLLLAGPALTVWRMWREPGRIRPRRMIYVAILIAINVTLLAGLAAFKLRTTVRLGTGAAGLAGQISSIARHAVRTDVPDGEYGLNVPSAVRVHFGDYGVKLPGIAVKLAPGAPAAVLWLTAVFGLAAFAYLHRMLRAEPWPSLRDWAAVVFAGIVVFGLGYAIFLTNYNVQFTPTGIANRSAIAAALGAAMCLAGCTGLLTAPFSASRAGPLVFAAVVSVFASSGFLIVNVVAERWVAAYAAERDVLAGIRQRLPALAPHSTLILDGVCPYVGPAIVFEANWDLAGALQAMYRDATLRADVVTPRLVVGDDGITTTIYRQPARYEYGGGLFVYHASGRVQPLPDAASARAYFAASSRGRQCPPGREGIGVEMF